MKPILLFGPTASGKSALALALARLRGGAVVNADSLQGHRALPALTARPSAADEAAAPHHLYGHLDEAEDWSAGAWLRQVEPVLGRLRDEERPAVIVGGTGLYFVALTEGLPTLPPVPPALRARGEAELERLGLSRFAARLSERDPATAATLDLGNPRRVLRAWEVLEATGEPLVRWQARTAPPLLGPGQAVRLVLAPPRAWLQDRIGRRLDAMLAAGALGEVRGLLARDPARRLPVWKALGAHHLADHLEGRTSLDAARARTLTATRRYAKRQRTWARGRMGGWAVLEATDPGARLRAALALAADPR